MHRPFKWTLLTSGCLLMAIGVYFFELPNGFVTGGISGIGLILARLTPISPALWILLLNALLLAAAFLALGRATGVKTVYCTLLYSLSTLLLERFFPLSAPLTDLPLLELIFAVLLCAIGSAIMFHCGGSGGGTDIVALILKKLSRLNIGTVVLIADLITTLSSFFFFGIKIGLLSLLGLFARAFLVDGVIEGFNSCKYFVVITEQQQPVTDYITSVLERGVTVCQATGGYTNTPKAMIHVVCTRREALLLKAMLCTLDPQAFVIATTSHEIIGNGFHKF